MTTYSHKPAPHWQPLKLFMGLSLASLLGVTWFMPQAQEAWQAFDNSVFLSLNGLLVHSVVWQWWVAFLNTRWFDLLLALLMATPFLVPKPFWQHEKQLMEFLLFLGVLGLFVVIRILAKKTLFDFDRESPSLVFTQAVVLKQSILGLLPRVSSGHSFPGDHAAILLVWAMYIGYIRNKAWSFFALGLALLFVFPRLIAGGHWFSDVAVGGLMMALVSFSCAIFTPWRYYSEVGGMKVWQYVLALCPEWMRRRLSLCEVAQKGDKFGEPKAR